MLVLMLDSGGLDVLPPRGFLYPKDMLKLDSCFEDIIWCEPDKLSEWADKKQEELPRILAIDFSKLRVETPNELYVPAANKLGYQKFVDVLRTLNNKCPFATVVLDPATGLSEIVHQHIAGANSKRLEDTMKWSPDIGYQIIKTQGTLSTLPCHTVMLMHETSVMEMDDKTRKTTLKEVRPMLPSKFARERIGGLFAQFLYQDRNMGKPEVLTADSGYIKAGLGCRWPLNLPSVVGPLFKDIYERP